MTEIPTCPTCNRRPSERIAFDRSGYGCTYCCDPIHDLADQGPALKAERDEARALVLKLFRRGCIVERAPDRYDHVYSATYQEAQAALIAWGSVKREECVRE